MTLIQRRLKSVNILMHPIRCNRKNVFLTFITNEPVHAKALKDGSGSSQYNITCLWATRRVTFKSKRSIHCAAITCGTRKIPSYILRVIGDESYTWDKYYKNLVALYLNLVFYYCTFTWSMGDKKYNFMVFFYD